MRKLLLVLGLVALLTGCEENKGKKPDNRLPTVSHQDSAKSNRFVITKVNVVYDRLAYNDYRGIYIIVDTENGMEYFGVSGIGNNELGSHKVGKNPRREDER